MFSRDPNSAVDLTAGKKSHTYQGVFFEQGRILFMATKQVETVRNKRHEEQLAGVEKHEKMNEARLAQQSSRKKAARSQNLPGNYGQSIPQTSGTYFRAGITQRKKDIEEVSYVIPITIDLRRHALISIAERPDRAVSPSF